VLNPYTEKCEFGYSWLEHGKTKVEDIISFLNKRRVRKIKLKSVDKYFYEWEC